MLRNTYLSVTCIVLVGLFVMPLFPCAQQADKKESLAEQLTKIDATIAAISKYLDTYPPSITDPQVAVDIGNKLGLCISSLADLLKEHPNNAAIQWRLGRCFQLAHNADLPKALEKAMGFLRDATNNDPNCMEAHLFLGLLIVNSDPKLAKEAEGHLLQAIKLISPRPNAEAIMGLVFAYYYQGNYKDAIDSADSYLILRPSDQGMAKMKALLQEKAKTGKPPKIVEVPSAK
jgi:tetratricopeptide (TPR) repeat protein